MCVCERERERGREGERERELSLSSRFFENISRKVSLPEMRKVDKWMRMKGPIHFQRKI